MHVIAKETLIRLTNCTNVSLPVRNIMLIQGFNYTKAIKKRANWMQAYDLVQQVYLMMQHQLEQ